MVENGYSVRAVLQSVRASVTVNDHCHCVSQLAHWNMLSVSVTVHRNLCHCVSLLVLLRVTSTLVTACTVAQRVGHVQTWVGHIQTWVGHIQMWVGHIQTWVGHIQTWVGHIQNSVLCADCTHLHLIHTLWRENCNHLVGLPARFHSWDT